MPLNHLGFILRFHDIRTKLPEPAEMERYRGVLTWFAGSVANGNAYLAWASQVSRMNVRYVILGDIGVAINSANILAVNRLLDLAGVHHTGDYIAPTLGTRVVQKDQNLVEFECRLGPVLPDYPVINAIGAGTRIGLMLETPVHDGRRRTVLWRSGKRRLCGIELRILPSTAAFVSREVAHQSVRVFSRRLRFRRLANP